MIEFLTTHVVRFDKRSKVSELKEEVRNQIKLLKEASERKRPLAKIGRVTALVVHNRILYACAIVEENPVIFLVNINIDRSSLIASIAKQVQFPNRSLPVSLR